MPTPGCPGLDKVIGEPLGRLPGTGTGSDPQLLLAEGLGALCATCSTLACPGGCTTPVPPCPRGARSKPPGGCLKPDSAAPCTCCLSCTGRPVVKRHV